MLKYALISSRLAAASLLLLPRTSVAAADFASAADIIKPSLVLVGCAEIHNGQSRLTAWGTGFFVNQLGDVVTAAHVVEALPYSLPRSCTPVIEVPIEGWPREQRPTIRLRLYTISCLWDAVVDIAACRPTQNPFADNQLKTRPTVARLDISSEREATAVAFTGFPLQTQVPVTSVGVIAAYLDDQAGARVIIIDKIAWSGYSGSPLYLNNGNVVGIILWRGSLNGQGNASLDSLGLSAARTAGYLETFLAEHNIHY